MDDNNLYNVNITIFIAPYLNLYETLFVLRFCSAGTVHWCLEGESEELRVTGSQSREQRLCLLQSLNLL